MKRFNNLLKATLVIVPLVLAFSPMLALSNPNNIEINNKSIAPKIFKAPNNLQWKSSNAIYTDPTNQTIFFSNEQISLSKPDQMIQNSQVFSTKVKNVKDMSQNKLINNGSHFSDDDKPDYLTVGNTGAQTNLTTSDNKISYLTHFYNSADHNEFYTVSDSNGNSSALNEINDIKFSGKFLGPETSKNLNYEILISNQQNNVLICNLNKVENNNMTLPCNSLNGGLIKTSLRGYVITHAYVAKDGWFFTTNNYNGGILESYNLYYVNGFDSAATVQNIVSQNAPSNSNTTLSIKMDNNSNPELSGLAFSAKYDSLIVTNNNNQLTIVNKNKAYVTTINDKNAYYIKAPEFSGTVPYNNLYWLQYYYPEFCFQQAASRNNIVNSNKNNIITVSYNDESNQSKSNDEYYKISTNGQVSEIKLNSAITKSTVLNGKAIPNSATLSRIIASDEVGSNYVNYVLSTTVSLNKITETKTINNILYTQIDNKVTKIYQNTETVALISIEKYMPWVLKQNSMKYANYLNFAITENHNYHIINQSISLGGKEQSTNVFTEVTGSLKSGTISKRNYQTTLNLNFSVASFQNYFYYYSTVSVYQNTLIMGARSWLLSPKNFEPDQATQSPAPIILSPPTTPVPPKPPHSSNGMSTKTKVIIGVLVPVAVIGIGALIGSYYWKKNHKKITGSQPQ